MCVRLTSDAGFVLCVAKNKVKDKVNVKDKNKIKGKGESFSIPEVGSSSSTNLDPPIRAIASCSLR